MLCNLALRFLVDCAEADKKTVQTQRYGAGIFGGCGLICGVARDLLSDEARPLSIMKSYKNTFVAELRLRRSSKPLLKRIVEILHRNKTISLL